MGEDRPPGGQDRPVDRVVGVVAGRPVGRPWVDAVGHRERRRLAGAFDRRTSRQASGTGVAGATVRPDSSAISCVQAPRDHVDDRVAAAAGRHPLAAGELVGPPRAAPQAASAGRRRSASDVASGSRT